MFKFLGLIVVHVQFITISVKNASLQPRFLQFNLNDNLSNYPYYIHPALHCFFFSSVSQIIKQKYKQEKKEVQRRTLISENQANVQAW